MTPARLRELLRYDQYTGEFVRLVDRQRYRAGTIAGSFDARGYLCIGLDGKTYKSHRLAWLYMTGAWPEQEIDHIDGDRSNNRFDNLRPATHEQNARNQKLRADNIARLKGVRLNGATWQARIRIAGRTVSIGEFDSPEMAHGAYVAKAQEIFGEFARNG